MTGAARTDKDISPGALGVSEASSCYMHSRWKDSSLLPRAVTGRVNWCGTVSWEGLECKGSVEFEWSTFGLSKNRMGGRGGALNTPGS